MLKDTECPKCGSPEELCEGCPALLAQDATLDQVDLDACPACHGTGLEEEAYHGLTLGPCEVCEGLGQVAFTPPY